MVLNTVCENCGKEIKISRFRSKFIRHFCSRKCYGEWKKGKHDVEVWGQSAQYIRQKIVDSNIGKTCPWLSEYNKKHKSKQMKGNIPATKGKKFTREHKPENGEWTTCDYCGNILFRLKSHKKCYKKFFCNMKCRNGWLKTRNKENDDGVKKQSESMKRLFSEHPEQIKKLKKTYKTGVKTSIEILTEKFLQLSGFDEKNYIYQFFVKTEKGPRFVDFCIPSIHLLIECDGNYWHKNPEREKMRDKEILETLGNNWKIEHLKEKEIYDISSFLGFKLNYKKQVVDLNE